MYQLLKKFRSKFMEILSLFLSLSTNLKQETEDGIEICKASEKQSSCRNEARENQDCYYNYYCFRKKVNIITKFEMKFKFN